MAWVYGADQFLEDLKFMLGFYPFPYFFWKWGWKIISPSIVVVSSPLAPDSVVLSLMLSVYPGVHCHGLLR